MLKDEKCTLKRLHRKFNQTFPLGKPHIYEISVDACEYSLLVAIYVVSCSVEGLLTILNALCEKFQIYSNMTKAEKLWNAL